VTITRPTYIGIALLAAGVIAGWAGSAGGRQSPKAEIEFPVGKLVELTYPFNESARRRTEDLPAASDATARHDELLTEIQAKPGANRRSLASRAASRSLRSQR
jgi:hypothetical protein